MYKKEPFIEQIRIGKPKTLGLKNAEHPLDREWTSAIFKEKVTGKVKVHFLGLEGDGQADVKHHGGREKAIFAYPISHYSYWQQKLTMPHFTIGAFGENLAIQHLTENDVCIGDIYRIGTALVQVSQPRQPCWKPARRWRVKNLSLLTQEKGLTGWYLRVLEEGEMEEGDAVQLVERRNEQWTIAECNEVMHHEKENLKRVKMLANCELLSPSWRDTLNKRAQGIEKNSRRRLFGPNE